MSGPNKNFESLDIESTSITQSGSVVQTHNPRTYQTATLPNISDLRNNLTQLKSIDSHVQDSFGRVWYCRADSELGKHHLYYATGSDEISLLYSDDGWNWTEYTSNPVLTGAGRNFQVVKKGDSFHGFYNPTNTEIRHTTSADGYSDWSSSGNTQILSASSSGWDTQDVRYPGVIHYEGQWWMYYMGRDSSGTWRIGLATANDPDDAFQKHPCNPVVTPTGQGGPDSGAAYDPHPCIINDKLFLWYTGGDVGTEQCSLAVSHDMVNFNKHRDNPIISSTAFNMAETLNPSFVPIGNELYGYFCSRDNSVPEGSIVQTRATLYKGV